MSDLDIPRTHDGPPEDSSASVAADKYDGAGRAGLERAAHAYTEIAAALADRLDPGLPVPPAMASLVRRHRDPHTPAPVTGETAQHQRDR